MKMNIAAAALCATALTASPSALGFTFNDINYWVGNGTNKCAVVIDFNDGSVNNCSFAWGYRWNGDAPSMMTILRKIEAADSRLKVFASQSQYGSFLDAFAYDADGDGGTFERVWNSATYAYDCVKSDVDDLFPTTKTYSEYNSGTGGYSYSGTSWMQLWGTGNSFEDVAFTRTPNGVDSTFPTNGQWICWRFSSYATEYAADWSVLEEYYYTDSEHIPVAAAKTLRQDTVRYWVGSGTNKCVVVVDFNDGSVNECSFAWGYRWNGDATNMMAILRQIEAADSRLKVFASQSQYGSFLDAFAYDADGDGGTFERVWNSATYAYDCVKSDVDDLFPTTKTYSEYNSGTGGYSYSGTSWMQLWGTGNSFEDVAFTRTPNGVDSTFPTNGQWICWRFSSYATEYAADWSVLEEYYYTDSEYKPVSAIPAPTIADFVVGDTSVTVVPGNVADGYYYGLAVATNLTEGFSAPTEWVRAANGTVVLEKAKNAAAKGEFYKVRVSDIDETAQ